MSKNALRSLETLRVNPDWAKLPLFDRKGWKRVRFGDVVRVLKEQVDPSSGEVDRYVAGEHMETENVHIRTWGNVGDGYLGPAFIRRFRKGQVLYGSRRTYLKKVAVAEWDGVTSNTTLVLEAVEDMLLQKLLPWLMLSERFTKHSVQESKGSTNPYINWPDIAKLEFDLPSLAQQRRIAELLWSLDESVQKVDALRKSLRVAKSAFTDTLFSDSAKGRNRHEMNIKLGGVCRLQSGFPFKSSDFVAEGDRLLRCSNVGVHCLRWEDEITRRFPSERRVEVADFVLNPGDIVIAMDRPFISEGFKIARVQSIDIPALLLQRVGRFLPSEKIDIEFLWMFLNSRSFQDQLRLTQQGTDLPHVSRFDIESTELVLPHIEEQIKHVEQYNLLSESEVHTRTQVASSLDLGRFVLQVIFDSDITA